MKPAFQKDEALIADIAAAQAREASRIWWLGQSGFLLLHRGRVVLCDPYLSDSLTRKYANTDKPHERLTERVVAPEALAAAVRLDLVTSSHNHTDHLDAETLKPLLQENLQAPLVIAAANRELVLARLGRAIEPQLLELDQGASVELAGIEIHGIAAAHNTVERDAAGRCRFLGFVARWEGFTVYHSGDTLRHDGLVPALLPFRVDLALLPINGNRPERRVAGNLDGRQAAQLAHDIGARCVIPCHYDLFAFNTADPGDFIAECRRLNQPFQILRNGEGWSW